MLKRIPIWKWGGGEIIFTAELHLVWCLASSWALHYRSSVDLFPIIWCSGPSGPCSQGISRGTLDTCAHRTRNVWSGFYLFSPILCLFPYFQSVNEFFFMRCLRSNGLQALSSAVFHDMKTSLQMFCCTHKCIITELVRCLKGICEHFNLNSLSVCIITLNLCAYLAK